MARLSLLQVGRLVALFLVTFISSVAFGISVHMISAGTLLIEETILSVVAAVLTLVTVPTMVLVDFCRRRTAFLSYIAVELVWLSTLWIFWLAATAVPPGINDTAKCATPGCSTEVQITRVFSFLSFITLFVYTLTLLLKTHSLLRTSDRPARVWTGSVRTVFGSRRRLRMTLLHIPPPSPGKSGFGFVVEQDDDPFHPEPVSARSPSVLFPSPHSLSPMVPASAGLRSPSANGLLSPVSVRLPSPVPPVYLQV